MKIPPGLVLPFIPGLILIGSTLADVHAEAPTRPAGTEYGWSLPAIAVVMVVMLMGCGAVVGWIARGEDEK